MVAMPYKNPEDQRRANRRTSRTYYANHPEERRREARERMKRRRQAAYAYVNEIKASTPCADCKLTFDPICMDFDHVNDDKFAGVSRLINYGYSLDKIKTEIAKCELVCANCHRLRTRDRT